MDDKYRSPIGHVPRDRGSVWYLGPRMFLWASLGMTALSVAILLGL